MRLLRSAPLIRAPSFWPHRADPRESSLVIRWPSKLRFTGMDLVTFDLGIVANTHLTGALRRVVVPGYGKDEPVGTPAEIAAAEADCVAWATRVGLIDAAGPYAHKFRLSQLAALAAHTLPDVAPARAAWFIRLQAFIFTLDDALDNLRDIRVDAAYLAYERVHEVLMALERALAGAPRDPERERALSRCFPLFAGFRDALAEIRELALADGGDLQWFVESMRKYFEAMAWEHAAHTDATYSPTASTYLHNREQTISYIQSIESFLLLKRVALAPALRRLHPVGLLLTDACRHVILVNDIFSLAKEIACDELDNLLLLDPRASARRPLRRRFEALVEEVNELAADITHIARGLLAAFPDDADLVAYVETIINSVNGHIDWYAHSLRYGTPKQALRAAS